MWNTQNTPVGQSAVVILSHHYMFRWWKRLNNQHAGPDHHNIKQYLKIQPGEHRKWYLIHMPWIPSTVHDNLIQVQCIDACLVLFTILTVCENKLPWFWDLICLSVWEIDWLIDWFGFKSPFSHIYGDIGLG